MRVKQSEIRTNGPWRMRTGHANGMRWIPGRRVVAHVEVRKTRECEIRKMRENAKCAGYASARIANCMGTRDVHNSWDARKCEESETRIARKTWYMRNAKCAKTRNAKREKCDVRDMCENAKCAKMRKARKRRNAKTRKPQNREGRRTSTGPV